MRSTRGTSGDAVTHRLPDGFLTSARHERATADQAGRTPRRPLLPRRPAPGCARARAKSPRL